MAINTKLGDSNQNSYIGVSQADTYFGVRRNVSNWTSLTATNKEIVLQQAARDIDRFRFYGEKYYDSQGLKFPRDDHEIVTGNCSTPITATSFKNSNLYSTTYNAMPDNYWKYGSIHITVGTPIRDTRDIKSSSAVDGTVVASPDFSSTPTTNSQFIIFKPVYKEVMDAQCEQALYILDNAKLESLTEYRDLGAETIKIGDAVVVFKEGGFSSLALSPTAKKLLSKFIQKSLTVQRA